ncbi:Rv3235 family protein [Tomitella cavernea]|uniref:Alanine, arginine and proline rich protein n=1 Tax=Tomitella cavernea TaxID=1387982 RepID=A0ABP9CEC9_9ACTN|nr:Rv3235 family protein [Tomitella cavernea]
MAAPTETPRHASLHNPPFVEYGAVPVLDSTMRYLSRPPNRPVPAADVPPTATAQAPSSAQDVSSNRATAPVRTRAPGTRDAAAVEVRRRVEVTLRLVLEVLDLRRRPEHLEGFVDASVLGMVRKLARTSPPGRQLGSAVLRRIHITSAGAGAAEICATYVRGRRTLAIAGRFERKRGAWVCTALHLA